MLRHKVLSILLAHQGEYLSGQALSKHVGVSRTAIWKYIEELRQEGYEIEAKPRKGYRLKHRPDRVAAEEILQELQTTTFGQNIRYEPVAKSTQILAHQWAKAGAMEGSLVIANEQQAGKGRLGRDWHSPAGSGIWLSLIVRPPIPIQQASQMTLLAAVAVTSALIQMTTIPIQIKWPNDLLINGKKVCGILTELRGEQDRIDYMVLGIGINVHQQSFPPSLEHVATSLAIEKKQEYSRARLIAAMMKELEQHYRQYLQDGFAPIQTKWEQLSSSIGKKITAKTPQAEVVGIAEKLQDDGSLLVRTGEELVAIYSAEINQ
jgi:BirA family biotin operon repressor/biotin-[acetyl-CoA-carboxylase] ligase